MNRAERRAAQRWNAATTGDEIHAAEQAMTALRHEHEVLEVALNTMVARFSSGEAGEVEMMAVQRWAGECATVCGRERRSMELLNQRLAKIVGLPTTSDGSAA